MAPQAATATTSAALTAALLLITIAVTVGYAGLCWLLPFRPCPHCQTTGYTRTAVLKRSHPCRRCKGDGVRLRTGRRLFNHLARQYRNTR